MLCAEHLLTVLLSAAHWAGDPGEADLRERGQGEDGDLPGIYLYLYIYLYIYISISINLYIYTPARPPAATRPQSSHGGSGHGGWPPSRR